MNDDTQRIRFRISGRVQGVGFRVFVQREAALKGLSGWVRNTWDGKVEGEAEGPGSALDALQVELRHGPPSGFVEICAISPIASIGERPPFRIRRDG